jgi:hypothetical protein
MDETAQRCARKKRWKRNGADVCDTGEGRTWVFMYSLAVGVGGGRKRGAAGGNKVVAITIPRDLNNSKQLLRQG